MSDICEKCGCPDHLTHDMLERNLDETKKELDELKRDKGRFEILNLKTSLKTARQQLIHHKENHKKLLAWLKMNYPSVFQQVLKEVAFENVEED